MSEMQPNEHPHPYPALIQEYSEANEGLQLAYRAFNYSLKADELHQSLVETHRLQVTRVWNPYMALGQIAASTYQYGINRIRGARIDRLHVKIEQILEELDERP